MQTKQPVLATRQIGEGITVLPRGGYLVESPIGYIQFGLPPETIKDTMRLPGGVPQIFVLPNKLFHWVKGISLAELEFPIYYNFFLKQKKTYIICRRDQFEPVKNVLQEALFGPRNLDIRRDYADLSCKHNIPDIKSEMDFFRQKRKLSDLVAFGVFNERGKFTYKGLTITLGKDGDFHLYGKGNKLADIPGDFEYKATYLIGERLPEPYLPPPFGVTCLGPSHGFDPLENTSGFIIWLNHHGIMIDPPVNATEWLVDSNVNPKFIDSIILTHCHADHDAGTFQKILEEERITIYSTETVMMSFLSKYANLTNVSISYLMKLFDFHPVKIGRPAFIHNGRFDMFYTLHSIPTVGFRMQYQDKTFVYSSDHNNDPELHKRLLIDGVINSQRYNELSNFAWDCDVIYHESGVPPLHTPISYLNSLPEKIQRKVVVYHIAQKDFPKNTDLTLAKFGIENTLYFETTPSRFSEAAQILGILRKVDMFRDMPISKSQEFLNIVVRKEYKPGDYILRQGTAGDTFFIIMTGNVSIDLGGLEQKKIFGSYDTFGEVALFTRENRTASVIAETHVVAYSIEREYFLNFIVGSEYEGMLMRLAEIRSSETWNLLSMSQYFRHCTSSQKTWIESMLIPMDINEASTIIGEGDKPEYIYIVREGEVSVYKSSQVIANLTKGDLIGRLHTVYSDEASDYSYFNHQRVSLYSMKKDSVVRFIDKNPGLLMKLIYDYEKSAKDNSQT